MDSATVRKRFLRFFEERGHAIVPSSSLIPDDPSVLLTTAGMQQFKPYYTGDADPLRDFGSKNTASIQKSFRTSDIDEVGDDTHLTFFEMLGNFSFGYKPGEPVSPQGGYGKSEAIRYAYEFITREMGLPISRVSVFKGSASVPKDEESRAIWQELGVSNIGEEGMEDVFWGPTGSSGPCGPTTEIYCRNAAGEDVEIWNIVFNQFYFPGSREELLRDAPGKALAPLKMFGVDTGMGLERLAMIAQGKRNIFETDLFRSFVELLPGDVPSGIKRTIIDHLRGSVFLIADGVKVFNKGAGYVLRRLLRRVFVYENVLGIPQHAYQSIVHDLIHEYGQFYPEIAERDNAIREEIETERERFSGVLERGKKRIEQMILAKESDPSSGFARRVGDDFGEKSEHFLNVVSGDDAFELYQSEGMPVEAIEALLAYRGYTYHKGEFKRAFEEAQKKHQEISRAGVEKKFGGHGLLLDTGELKAGNKEELNVVTRLHTATHLLNAALHTVLGDAVEQRGSDITAERTRFDFLFPRKLTTEEIQKIEGLVNDAIRKDLPVTVEELPLAEAKASGTLFFSRGHYPDRVKVYTVGRGLETFSRELCGGPHVTHTGEIGTFRIRKEESSSAGVRRIRATVEG